MSPIATTFLSHCMEEPPILKDRIGIIEMSHLKFTADRVARDGIGRVKGRPLRLL